MVEGDHGLSEWTQCNHNTMDMGKREAGNRREGSGVGLQAKECRLL